MPIAVQCREQRVSPASFHAKRIAAAEELSILQFVEALIADSGMRQIYAAGPAPAGFATTDGIRVEIMDRDLAVEPADKRGSFEGLSAIVCDRIHH